MWFFKASLCLVLERKKKVLDKEPNTFFVLPAMLSIEG